MPRLLCGDKRGRTIWAWTRLTSIVGETHLPGETSHKSSSCRHCQSRRESGQVHSCYNDDRRAETNARPDHPRGCAMWRGRPSGASRQHWQRLPGECRLQDSPERNACPQTLEACHGRLRRDSGWDLVGGLPDGVAKTVDDGRTGHRQCPRPGQERAPAQVGNGVSALDRDAEKSIGSNTGGTGGNGIDVPVAHHERLWCDPPAAVRRGDGTGPLR